MLKTMFKRLKASTLSIPEYKYAVRYREVILEIKFGEMIDYATAVEAIDNNNEECPYWFFSLEGSKEIPLQRFEDRMKTSNLVEDKEFIPDKEYKVWK